MGSGVNRKFWAEKGTRSGRRSGTKSGQNRKQSPQGWVKAKAWRAEAKRRFNV
jgi:hypothetical protein